MEEQSNPLAYQLSTKLYLIMRERLIQTLNGMQNLIPHHQHYTTNPCPYPDQGYTPEDRQNAIKSYKDQMIELSSIVEIIDTLSARDDNSVQTLNEMLSGEQDAQTTLDHLDELLKMDTEIRENKSKLDERLRKLRDTREELELLYISKTIN